MKVRKNSLSLTMQQDGSFVCDDLEQIPELFNTYTEEKVHEAIDKFITALCRECRLSVEFSKRVKDMSDEDRHSEGIHKLNAIINSLKDDMYDKSLFEQFMFWLGDWWYYHPDRLGNIAFVEKHEIYRTKISILEDLLIPLLPEPVKESVSCMDFAEVAHGFGHFAFMFINQDKSLRRIITDTQLFEIHDVYGYVYLDITELGKPIMRSACCKGGGRAFFDGYRLMSHDNFYTCAPKTVIINGGYKVNSTHCTIVNGMLFDLIDADDEVAHTCGAFFGCTCFSAREQNDAIFIAEQSGVEMHVTDDRKVFLRGKELKPLGVFQNSIISLLNNGFSKYEWSEFIVVEEIKYGHVLIVDDKAEWIETVTKEFGKEIDKLEVFQTTSARAALEKIMETKPDAVLLDMHLNEEERFDGLWIANKLISSVFAGDILITSSYAPETLRAMQKLIKGEVAIPGKDVDRLRKCLYGKNLD